MKPILYAGTETSFESFGFGRIDAITCAVTEEINGVYELEMDVTIDSAHYADLREGRLLLARHDDSGDRQPFEIYKISRPINGRVTVFAQHISYRTAKMVVLPFTASSAAGAMSAIAQNCVGGSSFTFWTDIVSSATFTVEKPTALREVLGDLIDVYGGEYEWDGMTIRLRSRRGSDTDVTLRYGNDITNLKKTTDMSDLWTGAAPFWQGRDPDDPTSVVTVTLTEKVVYAAGYTDYDYGMVIPLDLSTAFDEPPTEAALRTAAQAWVAENAPGGIPASIDVSFVALWQSPEYQGSTAAKPLKLGDKLRVLYARLGVDSTVEIIKTVYNVLLERYDGMTIGQAQPNLASVIQTGGVSSTGDAERPKSVTISVDGLRWMRFSGGRLVEYG